MRTTLGIDVGSGAVKAAAMRVSDDGAEVLAHATARIRRRDVASVIDEVVGRAVQEADLRCLDYIASTGEGEEIPYATGHFYGMTTHARGALFLDSRARTVLDVGALHARAVSMDARGKVLDYKMTSQCASGSGQFLENIARYLGVSLAEVGPLSLLSDDPEKVSSICAVLAETDVINMVSRGISTANILRGIHDSMAGRFARLIRSLKVEGVVFVSGGLAEDIGLLAALRRALDEDRKARTSPIALISNPLSICAGAIGAALWGAFRADRANLPGAAWTAASPIPKHTSSSAASERTI